MNNLVKLRESRGWSQARLGKELSCASITISRYETGQRDMDSETICKLCDIFHCSADYLLCRAALPSPELEPEEETLLLAWRAAPPEIRAIIDTALAPYKKDAISSETA